MSTQLEKEINTRRTFAIISHPDAGKTTLTEKLLLFGGAIQMAGVVKAKKSKKFATSDWMELEKKRGISVTSSVMKFPYKNFEINLIDTPGHQDFSEDTYRTLTAVDSALMLIDAANGVEAQTKKLFEVCRLQGTPVMAFINKMDREGKDPFELLDEIEKVLGIHCVPMTWPVGMGPRFRGVYHLRDRVLLMFDPSSDRSRILSAESAALGSTELVETVGQELHDTLAGEVELLEGAGSTFKIEDYLSGKVAPVFFGSALNSFGVETLLDALVEYAPPPLARNAIERKVDPYEQKLTGFVFKVQANMDPAHRDRIAFVRLVSGSFERGMKAYIPRLDREHRLARPTQFMAQDRSLVEHAVAGDIVGIHDPGIFRIGDTLTEGEKITFTGIPVFAPEHFVRAELKDPLKSKQLKKALDQLSEEGAVQVFRPKHGNDQFLGAVGILQFDVVHYRVENEYNVKVKLTPLSFKAARWIHCSDQKALDAFLLAESDRLVFDRHDQPTLLLQDEWRLKLLQEKYPKIEFLTIGQA